MEGGRSAVVQHVVQGDRRAENAARGKATEVQYDYVTSPGAV